MLLLLDLISVNNIVRGHEHVVMTVSGAVPRIMFTITDCPDTGTLTHRFLITSPHLPVTFGDRRVKSF